MPENLSPNPPGPNAPKPPAGPTPPANPNAPKPPAPNAPPAAAAPEPAAPAQPHHRDGRLTRAGMEHVIRSGGSVLHEGRTLTRVEELPSEAALAAGDEDATRTALDNLQRRREALEREEALLHAKGRPSPPPKGGK